MSDDSNKNDADKNTTIKDKDSDKKFFTSLGTWLVIFTINVMIGSYVIYASKILHVIQLPTNLDAPPYTITATVAKQQLNDETKEAEATLSSIYVIPRIKEQMTKNNNVGINYLDTFIQPPAPVVDAATATGAVAAPEPAHERTEYFTKIMVNPDDYKNIFNEYSFLGSSVYKYQTGILYAISLIITQQYYFYIYYSICYFFSFVYNNSKDSYWGESIMLIVGFPAFLLYFMFIVGLLAFLLPIWILRQVPKFWKYESTPVGIKKIDDAGTNTTVAGVAAGAATAAVSGGPTGIVKAGIWWFLKTIFMAVWRFCKLLLVLIIGLNLLIFSTGSAVVYQVIMFPYIFYIFYKIISITCEINNNDTVKNEPIDIKKPIGIKTIWYYILGGLFVISCVIPALFSLLIPLTLIINYIYNAKYTKPEHYSVASLVFSKIEIITIVIALIFLFCTKQSYGLYVFLVVLVLVLLIYGLSYMRKITFIFYPYIINDPNDNPVFIPVNGYTDQTTSGCYMPPVKSTKSASNNKDDDVDFDAEADESILSGWHKIFGSRINNIFKKVIKCKKGDEEDDKDQSLITKLIERAEHAIQILLNKSKHLNNKN